LYARITIANFGGRLKKQDPKWLFQGHRSSRLHACCNKSTNRCWRCL